MQKFEGTELILKNDYLHYFSRGYDILEYERTKETRNS